MMGRIQRGALCALIGAGFLVLDACSSTPVNYVECGSAFEKPGPSASALVGKGYGVQMAPIPVDSVMFASKDLGKKVGIQELTAARSESDTVRVTARFVNCGASPVQLSARVHFMDDKKRPSEKPSAWQNVFMQGKSFGVFSESSLGDDTVATYLVEVREAGR